MKLTKDMVSGWKSPEPELSPAELEGQRLEAYAELTKTYGELNAALNEQIAAYDRMEENHNKVIEEIRHTSPGLYQSIIRNRDARAEARRLEEAGHNEEKE
jgi:hypothetical protein